MDSNSIHRLGRINHHRQRTQQEIISPIVDDSKSSNPHSLLLWLKRQLLTFTPVNNVDFIPVLPPAA